MIDTQYRARSALLVSLLWWFFPAFKNHTSSLLMANLICNQALFQPSASDTMKFLATLSSFVLFVATVKAQASFIRLPTQGTTVQWYQNVVVQVVRPFSLQGSQEVGLAIGLFSCPNETPCKPPTEEMGAVLFRGPYDPQLHEMPGRPYQNYTVTIPPLYFLQGRALLTVTRFHLIGAGPAAALELNNVTINVINT